MGTGRAHVRARRAVTIIELIIVIIIAGIIAAMSVPHLNYSGYKADATARLVRGALQIAQRNAITRQSNIVVSFDLANKRVRVLEDANDNTAVDAGERVTFAPLEEGSSFATPPMGRIDGSAAGASIIGSALRSVDGMNSIILRRDGSASSDVEVYVTVRAAVNGDYRALVLTPSTGKVDLYRYLDTAWRRQSQ